MHDVLLLEENDLLREVLHHGLEDLGFRVLATASASEALRCLRAPRPPRLLLMDLELGIADEVRATWPDLPIVSYSERRVPADAALWSRKERRLAKPFRMGELTDAIETLGVHPSHDAPPTPWFPPPSQHGHATMQASSG
ncbi:CheY chemotaxis protein or a CheY-like REC (receiver) domain [Roseomonas rosea]|uniref:CheY chemotaxis protein or a CheY-like REC (Receiver) domain n=1 Tax=Muricoccus roseus TaxID=198092 RepID=A0A1M6CAA2_9PROT|nr:response regulator [Roseomonas rosea]SHI57950.1 CheY chemotaxis protein or a CheY-like REC (receiver) domain [Roseomonas rosea]